MQHNSLLQLELELTTEDIIRNQCIDALADGFQDLLQQLPGWCLELPGSRTPHAPAHVAHHSHVEPTALS